MGTQPRAPWLSREAWTDHPNYPEQVLLLGSHENFLLVNDYLIEQAGRVEKPENLVQRYRWWIAGMRSHERYEEQKLYPYLARRWGTSFEAAEEGHRLLHEKHDVVIDAFAMMRNAEGDERPAARAELVRALQDHFATLCDHLRTEEDAVIPLLLALGRDEFDMYCASSIHVLMRVLDQAEAEVRAGSANEGE